MAASSSCTEPITINLHPSSCPPASVTVYNDRAEVVRTIQLDVRPGSFEAALTGLSPLIDDNSVHISGATGKAVILEVSSKTVMEEQGDPNARTKGLETLREELKKTEETAKKLELELATNAGVQKWVSGLADYVQTTPNKSAKDMGNFLSPEYLEKIQQFTSFYSKQMLELGGAALEINTKLTQLRERIAVIKREINDAGGSVPKIQKKRVTIAFTAKEECKVTLQLSYMVKGASWHPSYDCRVDSATQQAQLTYYGIITNKSKDDWENTSVLLSTAFPSVGGEPPALPSAIVSFDPPAVPHGLMIPGGAYRTNRRTSAEFNPMMQCQQIALSDANDFAPPPPPAQILTTTASESATAATFEVPRKSTILSDNEEHKLTIAVIPLEMAFSYVVVPRMSEHSFLKATTKNTSAFLLLKSETCNIFIDGNFLATSSLKNISSGEEFAFFLGADKSVKVEYKMPSAVKSETGLIKKANADVYSGTICVKNGKSKEIAVVVYEQLPKPNASEIKVTSQEPQLPGEKDGVRATLNPLNNNIEWRARLSQGKELLIPIKYTIEYPRDKFVYLNN